MLLIDELDKLIQEAERAEDYFVAAILSYVCAAILTGKEEGLSEAMQTYVDMYIINE